MTQKQLDEFKTLFESMTDKQLAFSKMFLERLQKMTPELREKFNAEVDAELKRMDEAEDDAATHEQIVTIHAKDMKDIEEVLNTPIKQVEQGKIYCIQID